METLIYTTLTIFLVLFNLKCQWKVFQAIALFGYLLSSFPELMMDDETRSVKMLRLRRSQKDLPNVWHYEHFFALSERKLFHPSKLLISYFSNDNSTNCRFSKNWENKRTNIKIRQNVKVSFYYVEVKTQFSKIFRQYHRAGEGNLPRGLGKVEEGEPLPGT